MTRTRHAHPLRRALAPSCPRPGWKSAGVLALLCSTVAWASLPRAADLRSAEQRQWQALGIPLATVSARLGHSSPAITAQIYSHPLAVADREAARRIDEQFREGLERGSSDD